MESGLLLYQPQKLYYTAFPRGMAKLAVKIMPIFGRDPAALGHNKDINLKRIAEVEQVVTTKINVTRYSEASRQAARCYASQMSGNGGHAAALLGKLLFRFDSYTRIVPPFEGGRTERDLFAGIEER
jgi:hypothetical protein